VGATAVEKAVLPGIDFKIPVIGKVSFTHLLASPGFKLYCSIKVASTKAPPNS